jgi:hypothetical protein
VDQTLAERRESYENSTKLCRFRTEKYLGVTGCSESILNDMKLVKGLFPQRPSDVKKLQHHVTFFVVNLYHVYLQDPSRWVSYSRNKMKYTGKDSKYKHTFKLSHEYSVNKVIQFLLDNLYIEQSPFIHHSDPSKSRQSRIRATQKLIDLIRQLEEEEELPIPPGDDDAWGDGDDGDEYGEETIVVKGLKSKPKWIIREVDGVKSKVKIKGKRKICQTPDTPYVRQLRDNLQKINALMQMTEISLNVTPDELKELNHLLRGDKKSGTPVIDFTRKRLHRVFVDRRLDRGGRFYGPWYQVIPKEYREKIMINGVPVLEPDFSGYHPRILYAMKHLPLPEDPYRLDGYPETEEIRKFLKGMLLSIVNAKDEQDAIVGMRGQRFKDAKKARKSGKEIVPLGIEPLTDEKYREVMGKLMHRHEPIKEFFYTEMGSYLQYLDSQIAEAVMLYFAGAGRACLPVHDSFMVDFRLGAVLTDIMDQLFVQFMKQPVIIKGNLEQLISSGGYRLDLVNEMIDEGIGKIIEDMKDPRNKDRIEEWLKEAKKTVDIQKARLKELGIV